jgi:hypothetical protein
MAAAAAAACGEEIALEGRGLARAAVVVCVAILFGLRRPMQSRHRFASSALVSPAWMRSGCVYVCARLPPPRSSACESSLAAATTNKPLALIFCVGAAALVSRPCAAAVCGQPGRLEMPAGRPPPSPSSCLGRPGELRVAPPAGRAASARG